MSIHHGRNGESRMNRTAKEIAELTGLSFSNVRVRIYRLGLKPVEIKYGCGFYSEDQVKRIKENR